MIGVYPLLQDETCWFLAIDFDKGEWQQHVEAFLKTCDKFEIPAALERSQSGNAPIFGSSLISRFQLP